MKFITNNTIINRYIFRFCNKKYFYRDICKTKSYWGGFEHYKKGHRCSDCSVFDNPYDHTDRLLDAEKIMNAIFFDCSIHPKPYYMEHQLSKAYKAIPLMWEYIHKTYQEQIDKGETFRDFNHWWEYTCNGRYSEEYYDRQIKKGITDFFKNPLGLSEMDLLKKGLRKKETWFHTDPLNWSIWQDERLGEKIIEYKIICGEQYMSDRKKQKENA